MAVEEAEEPPPPIAGDLLEIHRPPLVSAVSPPPKSPWSMVAIRNHQKHGHGSNDPPIVFPPIDHENLHISPKPPATPDKIPYIHPVNRRILFSDSDSDSDSNSSSSFSPSDSSATPLSPLFPARLEANAAGRIRSWSEILNSKVNGLVQLFCSMFTSSRGVFFSYRSAAFAAVLVAFLYLRRRRRLSRARLIDVIKEKDEKINQLLDQISRMNQVLDSVHKVPTP